VRVEPSGTVHPSGTARPSGTRRRPDAAARTGAAVRRLLDDAAAVYADDPEAMAALGELRHRLDEPLRVALVGRVKAGKSTLLNALVGERLAPTDAGECTRVVTLYRHGAVPRVELFTAHAQRVLPVRRLAGALQLDLGGTPPEEVARLVVDWPAPDLATATLVDTPGISSLSADASGRTQAFLEAGHRLPGADAVVFLTRQMQPEDIAFLSSFQAGTGTSGRYTTTLTVLSRADEVGSGRLDALLAARQAADRMAHEPAVREVSSAVVPVAGLLALAGRLMRHRDFLALRGLAGADPAAVESMLLTADRFTRADTPVPLSYDVRRSLLERFGLFGIRLCVALVRTGVDDAAVLADELIRRSGLLELQERIAVNFSRRGAQLKAAAALRRLEDLLRSAPRPDAAPLWAGLERVRLSAHDLVELELLARSRAPDGPLPPPLLAEAERLLGAAGTDPAARLGLPADASRDELRAAAEEAVRRWRTEGAVPLLRRPTADAIDVVVRSGEEVLADLEELAPGGGSAPAAAHPAAGGPAEHGD
jgi:hypothetical protein